MDTTSYDMLSLVLHWLVKVQLFIQHHHNNEQDNIIKETRSLCCNVLPSLVAVINHVTSHMTLLKEDFLLSLLEFTHMTVSNIQKVYKSIIYYNANNILFISPQLWPHL